jgi:NAD(P)-dependent dehydrogenase (short-subunit alcohol dehydrogenase family)
LSMTPRGEKYMPIIENSEFEGKVVVITGAGGGLGRAHAIEYAKRGAKVVVNDLGGSVDGSGASDAADRVVAELIELGAEAVANKASVSDPEGAASIVQTAIDRFGRIDILVNNAGILRDKSFKKMTLEDWDIVLQVHLSGTAYVTHAAWPLMNAQGYGRIVLTSSGSGIYGNFGQTNYGAAKMGMVGMMNVLALEGAKNNVRVNTLAPAAATRMIATIPGREIDPENPPAERAPSLVSPAVLYMTSEEAPNGVIINAGNGKFYRAQVYVNAPIDLGVDATFESLMAESEQLLDMTGAKPRGSMGG